MADHRVRLVELVHAARYLLRGDANLLGKLGLLCGIVRHKLMERRINQADRDRQAVHRLEQAGEIAALEWQKLIERRAARLRGIGENHFLNRLLALSAFFGMLEILEEHVLGAAKTDALRAHGASKASIVWRIRIGAHIDLANLVRPLH